MSISKRNKGYTVRWRDSLGRQCSQQVTLYRDALTLDGEIKRKKAMGELVAHERGTARLADFWLLWLERYGQVYVTPRTLENYERLWRVHVEPTLGAKRLRDLTQEDTAALVARLSKKLSAASVRKVIAVLQGVLQRAVEWNYIPANPAQGVRKPRLISREGVALSPEQIAALRIELSDLRSKIIVTVLAGTGLRPGELRAMRWSDVGPTGITVSRAVSGNLVGPTKTNGARSVDLRISVHLALTEWQLRRGRHVDLIFPGASGGVWTDNAWRMWQRKVFAPAAARAGFPGLVPYDLRHTFVSTLIAEGRDVYWIARQAGHSPTMTLTTYGHLFESNHTEGARHDNRAANA